MEGFVETLEITETRINLYKFLQTIKQKMEG